MSNDLKAALAQLERCLKEVSRLKDRNDELRRALRKELADNHALVMEVRELDKKYECALTYAGTPTTPEEARKQIEEVHNLTSRA